MKTIKGLINEELILEYIIGKCNDYNVKFDLSFHGDERQIRDNNNNKFISKKEICYTLYKLSKTIKEDIDNNIINYGDIIGIIDKSRNVNYNCIINIIKENNYIILRVITHEYKNNFIFKQCKQIYTTYISDKQIGKKYKPNNVF